MEMGFISTMLICKEGVGKHQNTGLVSSGTSLTSWAEGASLALVGHPSSDGVTIKINALWTRCVTSTTFKPNLFLLDWLKLNLDLLLDQFETGLGR